MMDVALLFSWCFISVCLISDTSIAADTLRPFQNLTDGDTLISANRRFELGFFSPGNSSNHYLGIWYHNLPLTVVWEANKEDPIANSLGWLTLNGVGDLLLYNQSTITVWSTNSTVSVNNPILQLLGSGNLVVRDGDDYVWESFDHMSDTLLPGMKLGWKLQTSVNRFLTSWKSNDDPSNGEFTFSLDPPESPQLILRRGSEKQYRWGPFDGDRFSGSNELRKNAVFWPMFFSNADEVYYANQVLDETVLSRLRVTPLGLLQYYTWRNHSMEWSMMVTLNRDYCDRYELCGPYGNCYSADPNCRCLKGFTPRSPQDWRLADSSSGCRRVHELNCNNGDGFLKYTKLKLPDNSIIWANYTLEECRSVCLSRCDCMAYTGIKAHGNGNGNGSECVVWLNALIDMRNFPNGGEELYIRMARTELDSIADAKRKREVMIIVIVVVTVLGVFLVVVGGWFIIWATRTSRKASQDNNNHSNERNDENQEDDLELPLFDLDAIFVPTNRFSSENKIGQGGFGPVYKVNYLMGWK